MRSLLVLALAWLFFTLASSLFFLLELQIFRPDLLTVFTFYVARTRKLGDALVLSLFLGLLFAFFQHAAPLYFVLHGVALVALVRMSGRYVNLRHPFFVALFIFGMEIVLQGLMWSVIHATGPSSFSRQPNLLHQVLAVAGSSALVAPWLHLLLAWLERWLFRHRRDDVYLLR